MNKIRLLKTVNLLLFISTAVQAATGLALFFHLFVRKIELLKAAIEIHEHNGIALIVLIVLHLALNWGWVKGQFFKEKV